MYKRKFRYDINLDPDNRVPSLSPLIRGVSSAEEDKIIEELIESKSFIYVDSQSEMENELEGARLLYFNGKVLAEIQVCGCDSENHPGVYERRVSIKVLPPKSEVPKELSDFLEEKGFKKAQE